MMIMLCQTARNNFILKIQFLRGATVPPGQRNTSEREKTCSSVSALSEVCMATTGLLMPLMGKEISC